MPPPSDPNPTAASFDLRGLLDGRRGEGLALMQAHINPVFAKVLKTIGFDRTYERALGAHAWDAEGRDYLDFLGGYAVVNMGRNHPVIRRALEDYLALDAASWMQFDAPLLAGVLAEELVRRMPNRLERVFFTNSGTEGIECAIKFAKCATRRPAVVSTVRGFHGLTNGALGLNGDESFRQGFGPFLPGFRQVPFNDLESLDRELARGDVAAFVVEPIQGKGVNLPEPGYLAAAARLCRSRGALFVADEVQTGIGRTGSFLAIEQEGEVDPDMVVLSKALSGGYVPVGAVLVRRNVWERVFTSMDRAIVHSSTFHMGGLAMTAGLAALHVLDAERLAENARRRGEQLRKGLLAMQPRFEFLRAVRQRGLMIAIELGPPRSLRLRAAWSMVQAMDRNLFAQAVVMPLMDDHRIITQVAGHQLPVVKLIPPLVIDEADVQRFLAAFEQVMVGLHRFPGPVWDVLRRLGRNVIARDSAAGNGSSAAAAPLAAGTSP
ncbi:MAG: aspartate aminotransferase family protein [Phycisphaerales bacterium]|nr:aspartate aminotransferase family protein [Phycisphaerales bacterium]